VTVRLSALAALALTTAAFASGCGGGDDDAGAAALGKAEFLERANAACRKARAGLEDRVSFFLERQRGTKSRGELYGDLARLVLLPTVESEMEAVRALRIPPSERERITRLLYLQDLALTEVVYTERVPSIAAVKREFANSARQLRAYGLHACANGPEPRAAGA